MIDPFVATIIDSIVPDNALVIDIGGGRNPYYRADYVIDRRGFDERLGWTASGGQDKPARFSPDTWISRDFYELPWPFKDNQFDFSVCMHTLEDLRDPVAVAKEIQRVSKAGYISMPTRAQESCPFIEDRSHLEHGLVGYFHHRWFTEILDEGLIFKAKAPLIYNNPGLQIREVGQSTLNFFWNVAFAVREEALNSAIDAKEDIRRFKTRHIEFLRSLGTHNISLEFYNYWDDTLGPRPDFSKAISNGSISRLRYYLKVYRSKYLHRLFG